MKLTIKTMTGRKFDVDVKAEDKVKDVKAQLYSRRHLTGAMRLVHEGTTMEDNLALSLYSLPEGAMICAIIETDVYVNIEVSTGNQTQELPVCNSLAVMSLKVQVCGIMRCDMAPERMALRLGDVTLEDPMPLHFYGIKNGSKLDLLKPYIGATIVNNYGTEIFWRLERKDTVKEVKIKVATAHSANSGINISSAGSRLYEITESLMFVELDDDKTVDDCKIQDDAVLYLLLHRWTSKRDVTMSKTGRKLRGVEAADTCLGIKVRAQDQTGIPIRELKMFHVLNDNYEVRSYLDKVAITDEKNPFSGEGSALVAITQEELQVEGAKREEEERKAKEARKQAETRMNREKEAKRLKELLGIPPKKRKRDEQRREADAGGGVPMTHGSQ